MKIKHRSKEYSNDKNKYPYKEEIKCDRSDLEVFVPSSEGITSLPLPEFVPPVIPISNMAADMEVNPVVESVAKTCYCPDAICGCQTGS